MNYTCKICANTKNNIEYTAYEMLFGYKDKFLYFQCSNCLCLQIAEFPSSLDNYYPANYYSSARSTVNATQIDSLKVYLKHLRDESVLLNGGIVGKILNRIFPMDMDNLGEINAEINFDILKNRKLSFNSKVIDIGCGKGFFLAKLSTIGFRKLLGIDLFIDCEIINNRYRIEKKDILNIKGQFDLIVFNHSFEHMPDPLSVLKKIRQVITSNGICIIRIPIVSSYAWEKYGVNWVQLDAPRHFFLHSTQSMNLLLKKSDLKLQNIIYDSTDFQFWGSEQYVHGIPMRSSNSHWVNPRKSIFSANQIDDYKKKARELNNNNMGDQAAFYITK